MGRIQIFNKEPSAQNPPNSTHSINLERQRETDTQTEQTDRQTDRHRHRETQRDTDRQRVNVFPQRVLAGNFVCKNQSAVPKLGESTESCLIFVVVDAVGCFFVLFVCLFYKKKKPSLETLCGCPCSRGIK